MIIYERKSPKLRSSRRQWIVIILIAIAVHLAILFFFKPHYLSIFLPKIKPGESGGNPFEGVERVLSVVSFEGRRKKQEKKEEVKKKIEVEENTQETLDDILNNILPPDALTPIGIKGKRGLKPGGGVSKNIKPKPLYIPWPEVPRGASRYASGKVVLKVLVNEKGEVQDVKIVQGLPLKKLNDIAIRSAYNVKFSPGLKNGQPTPMWVELTISFQSYQ